MTAVCAPQAPEIPEGPLRAPQVVHRPQTLPTLRFGSYLRTRGLREALDMCACAFEDREMMTIWGKPGLGKTFAITEFQRSVTSRVAYIEARVSPTVRATAIDLYAALVGEVVTGTHYQVDDLLREELRRPETALVCVDEAQRFRVEGFEFLRSLHDDASLNFALIFVANPLAWQVICSHEALEQRMQYRYHYPKVGLREALKLLPAYHPAYAGCDDELLAQVFRVTDRANLRFLSKFTRDAVRVMQRAQVTDLNQDVIDATIMRMGERKAMPTDLEDAHE